jgi:small conductance mechanosensitive channel
MEMVMDQAALMEKYIGKAIEMAMEYGPRLLLAMLVLLIGLRVIKGVVSLMNNGFQAKDVDQTLRPFLTRTTDWALKFILFVSVASMIGVETTSLVALLGAGGLAIGLALQGTLTNFAGGVLILLFRPFKVGDLIEAQGYMGHVEVVSIIVTKIVTFDNKQVIIPNGSISNGSITNLSEKGFLRVDMKMGVAYNSDIRKAREVLMRVMEENDNVLKDPAPSVNVLDLGDSAIILAVRPFANTADYWSVRFDVMERGKRALDEAGIVIPFPQRDLHIVSGKLN